MKVHSFPPVIDERARVLVLGSMPGTASLDKGQYYGHPRNHFWPVIYGLFGEQPSPAYEKRIAYAQEKGIALWDTIATCRREGSLDANIQDELPNDLPGLLERYPGIRCIACNGAKSHDTFSKYYGGHPSVRDRIALLKLPSTSPIPTQRMRTTGDRIEVWRVIVPFLSMH
ncbi:DNA-deoxyinosine glycosylase [Paenibacillus oenotherae]|uniref:DNA-deoxyinosine glycosylase n=1 Tax=Paenibacillus oenotherae TaxID=1435645 RepID=A0ABS7DCV1_9BACL|nr:DNA-deoxyinosine glycosylase [Paenibacillus oenotherae]MBW7477772.1 DNA-deoxyinosine glycosylase [Paenibacillus oenotherae]